MAASTSYSLNFDIDNVVEFPLWEKIFWLVSHSSPGSHDVKLGRESAMDLKHNIK